MPQAIRDENGVTALIGASSADGTTPIRVTVDPATHILEALDGTTGTDYGTGNAARDENFVPVLLATSEEDGVTPVEVYADPATGGLLIDRT